MHDSGDEGLPLHTARGAFYLLAKSILTSLFSSIFFVFIARLLPTVSDLGAINSLQAIITLAVLFAGLGLTGASTRFMAFHSGKGRYDIAKGVGNLIFKIGFFSSTAVSIVIFLASQTIATGFFHNPTYTRLIQVGAIDVFFLSILTFCIYILYSNHNFRIVSILSILNSICKFGAASFLFIFMEDKLEAIIWGFVVGDAFGAVLFLYYTRDFIKGPILKETKELYRYAISVFGTFIISFFSVNIDYYLLVSFSGLYSAGIYTPAVVIGNVLIMILGALDQALLPYFSRTYGKSGLSSLKYRSQLTSRYLVLIYFPMGFILLCISPQLIVTFLGQKYSDSIIPSMILIIAITLTAMGTLFNNILLSTGHSKDVLVSSTFAVSIQIILTISTIPTFGAIGAAFARASAYAIMFSYSAYRTHKIGGLNYDKHALKISLIGSGIICVSLFLLNLLVYSVLLLPINLVVGVFSYLVVLRLTKAIKVEDLQVIDDIFMGKLRKPLQCLKKIVVVS